MMLSESKITTKRQITLPIRVMKKLKIKPGDRVIFEQHGRRIEIASATQNFTIDDFVNKHARHARQKRSGDEINAAKRQAWGQDF